MIWVFLVAAIVSEVSGTLALRMAAQPRGAKLWYALVVSGYCAAFVFLSFALQGGLALGVAYGIWAASGVAITAVASRVFFGEPLTRLMLVGIVLIIGGVLLVEMGAEAVPGR